MMSLSLCWRTGHKDQCRERQGTMTLAQTALCLPVARIDTRNGSSLWAGHGLRRMRCVEPSLRSLLVRKAKFFGPHVCEHVVSQNIECVVYGSVRD